MGARAEEDPALRKPRLEAGTLAVPKTRQYNSAKNYNLRGAACTLFRNDPGSN